MAKRLGASTDNCVFFDDNINALLVAKKSGMTVVGVYDDSSLDYEKEIKDISDSYIYRLSEFLTLKKTWL